MTNLLEKIKGFEPIINQNSKILILGTIPGNETIKNFKNTGNQDYYINFTHNNFWKTLSKLLGLNPALVFEKSDTGYLYRKQSILDNNLALWDIYDSCERKIDIAADKKIKNPIPNDIKALLKKYPNIKRVFTNGLGTFEKFEKYNKNIQIIYPEIFFKGLPSTSSANNGHFDIFEWENAIKV